MKCPVCHKEMEERKIERAWLDVCIEHGVWLDKGEIDTIIKSANEKGQNEGFINTLKNDINVW